MQAAIVGRYRTQFTQNSGVAYSLFYVGDHAGYDGWWRGIPAEVTTVALIDRGARHVDENSM
jgi:hypothetical protein